MGIDFSKIQQTSTDNPVNKTSSTANDTSKYGKTIGDVTLSDKAAEYYKSLKEKFGDMDFVLVSEDMKDSAEQTAASYANSDKTIVLINVDKVERMATDSSYRDKYEGIITSSEPQLKALQTMVQKSGSSNIQGVGMKVNDGGLTSFFAVLKQFSKDEKARIEKSVENTKAEKKEKAEKTAEAAEKERLESSSSASTSVNDDTFTITASSAEELVQKIQDYELSLRSDNVQSDAEKLVGQHIDFKG